MTVKEMIEELKRWMIKRFGKAPAREVEIRVMPQDKWQEPRRHAPLPAIKLGPEHEYAVRVDTALVTAAKQEIASTEREFGPNKAGEGKRHRTYARLLRQFPSHAKADVAIAIELAVRLK